MCHKATEYLVLIGGMRLSSEKNRNCTADNVTGPLSTHPLHSSFFCKPASLPFSPHSRWKASEFTSPSVAKPDPSLYYSHFLRTRSHTWPSCPTGEGAFLAGLYHRQTAKASTSSVAGRGPALSSLPLSGAISTVLQNENCFAGIWKSFIHSSFLGVFTDGKTHDEVSVTVLQRNRTDSVCVYRQKFILRNWLLQVQRVASPKSAGQANRPEAQARAGVGARAAGSLLTRPSPVGEDSGAFSLQAFNCLDRSPSHCGRSSALLWIYWLTCSSKTNTSTETSRQRLTKKINK